MASRCWQQSVLGRAGLGSPAGGCQGRTLWGARGRWNTKCVAWDLATGVCNPSITMEPLPEKNLSQTPCEHRQSPKDDARVFSYQEMSQVRCLFCFFFSSFARSLHPLKLTVKLLVQDRQIPDSISGRQMCILMFFRLDYLINNKTLPHLSITFESIVHFLLQSLSPYRPWPDKTRTLWS